MTATEPSLPGVSTEPSPGVSTGVTQGPLGLLEVALGALAQRAQEVGAVGTIWSGDHLADLQCNLVRLAPGEEIAEHDNQEVDVVLVGVDGAGLVSVGGCEGSLSAGALVTLSKGSRRRITAGVSGVSYLSLHRRRSSVRTLGSFSGSRADILPAKPTRA